MKRLNNIILLTLFALFPALAWADTGGLSFAPPPGDYSVIFLSNIFGIVDGVLHGTGSQMMGAMFAVFNSAILSLGGIIIMYTLIVSTMNTAHEGQMLGQKWSSIWIPVRSTLGLALLIPKASGYCLMQVGVMWLVVEGVGAADKVWEAALSYLNRGGVIIQAQATNPAAVLTSSGSSGVAVGALTMLSGQVCMLGLQKQLEAQRELYNNQPGKPYCKGVVKKFCETSVPDFLGSVNMVVVQQNLSNSGATPSSFSVNMPNFEANSIYSSLNGICGQLSWSPMNTFNSKPATGSTSTVNGASLSSDEYQTAQLSRAIAMQQMYLDLASVAQIMINNDPQISGATNSSNSSSNFNQVAQQQFGVPYTLGNVVCNDYSQNCVAWGLAANSSAASSVLFNGTEFLGAIQDYNGIMMPTLNLLNNTNSSAVNEASRSFIANAESQGWSMAGTYFFDLVRLNGHAQTNANNTDSETGMDASSFSASTVGGACEPNSPFFSPLCQWFKGDSTKLTQVQSLIDGTGFSPTPQPNVKNGADGLKLQDANTASSTVYGFINNSMMVRLPGQPGLATLNFPKSMTFSVDPSPLKLQSQHFDCGKVKIMSFHFCLGRMFGNLFYNIIFLNVYNIFMDTFQQFMQSVTNAFLKIPLQGMSEIFKQGVQTISMPGVNPIVALANMGVQYINFSGNLWINWVNLSIAAILIPWFGLFILALISMAMPLLLAWVGCMTGIGFVTAYYIPLLPYMMFLFGVIAWLMSVVEAMVAAPIVALGITHPEGHDAFGKGEQAIMIMLNVFLRPAMMIIGYIFAISLSYVGVWILNAGFDHAVSFYQSSPEEINITSGEAGATSSTVLQQQKLANFIRNTMIPNNKAKIMGTPPSSAPIKTENTPVPEPVVSTPEGSGVGETKYVSWAGVYAFFFSILAYTTIYMIIVQRAFTMISILPDKVLRWIGGTPENIGQESSQWGDELKQSGKEAGTKAQDAQGQMAKQIGGNVLKQVGKAKAGAAKLGAKGGSVSGEGGDAGDGK